MTHYQIPTKINCRLYIDNKKNFEIPKKSTKIPKQKTVRIFFLVDLDFLAKNFNAVFVCILKAHSDYYFQNSKVNKNMKRNWTIEKVKK